MFCNRSLAVAKFENRTHLSKNRCRRVEFDRANPVPGIRRSLNFSAPRVRDRVQSLVVLTNGPAVQLVYVGFAISMIPQINSFFEFYGACCAAAKFHLGGPSCVLRGGAGWYDARAQRASSDDDLGHSTDL